MPQKSRRSREPSLWRYLPLLPVSDPGGGGTPLQWPVGHRFFRRRSWPRNLACVSCGSRMKAATRRPLLRIAPVRWWLGVPARSGRNCGYRVHRQCRGSPGRDVGCHRPKSDHFAPKTAPPAKIAQLLVYGAQVILVDGNYDQAFDLDHRGAQEFGWYCRNTGYNPFTAEGKKTAALEIWETVLRLDTKLSWKNRPLADVYSGRGWQYYFWHPQGL